MTKKIILLTTAFVLCLVKGGAATQITQEQYKNMLNYANCKYTEAHLINPHNGGPNKQIILDELAKVRIDKPLALDALVKLLDENGWSVTNRNYVKPFYESRIKENIDSKSDEEILAILKIPDGESSRAKANPEIQRELKQYLKKLESERETVSVTAEDPGAPESPRRESANSGVISDSHGGTGGSGRTDGNIWAWIMWFVVIVVIGVCVYLYKEKLQAIFKSFSRGGGKRTDRSPDQNYSQPRQSAAPNSVQEKQQKRQWTEKEVFEWVMASDTRFRDFSNKILDDDKLYERWIQKGLKNPTVKAALQKEFTRQESLEPRREEQRSVVPAAQKMEARSDTMAENVETPKIENGYNIFGNVLYADCIYNGVFNRITKEPTDDTIFKLTKGPDGRTATFTIWENAHAKVLRRPEFADGCDTQRIGNSVLEIEQGNAALEYNTWKIIQTAKVKFL